MNDAVKIATELHLSHHRVAKDTIAYLTGGQPALDRAKSARKLDQRSATRADCAVMKHLRAIGLSPPRYGMPDAEIRPFFDLRKAVAAALIEQEVRR